MALRVLIAYDGSATAGTAVRAASALFAGARTTVATIGEYAIPPTATLTRGVPTISPDVLRRTVEALRGEARDEAERTAREGADRARAGGLDADVRATAVDAGAATGLLQVARETAADVLVCGTRGRAAFTRALLGSTASSLLHNADLPLLVVPDGAGALAGPAVLGYDGSEPAQRAIEAAGRLLARPAVVLHVWAAPSRHAVTTGALAGEMMMLDRALEEAATATIEDGVERARAAGLEAVGETIESGGGVWRAIVSAAREHDAAVIVTGARGLGGTRSALLGSVSSGLVHNADLPVLVVPPQDRG
jgi:nucleotide-binding universal stress UspA family protein